MKSKRYTTEEKIRMLRQADKGKTILEACRENNISEQTFPRWKREFGMIDVNQTKWMKELEPETVNSFEVGGKFGLFDQRATFNATMFYMDFEDFQLNTFNGIQFKVDNLKEVTSRGLELETTALLSEGLTVRGG